MKRMKETKNRCTPKKKRSGTITTEDIASGQSSTT